MRKLICLTVMFFSTNVHGTDVPIANEDTYIENLAVGALVQLVSFAPIQSSAMDNCGMLIQAKILDKVIGFDDASQSHYQFATIGSADLEVGATYLVLTTSPQIYANGAAQTQQSRCVLSQGQDILLGFPQSLFRVDDFFEELFGEKWLRMTARNVVGRSSERLKRLQIGQIPLSADNPEYLRVALGQYYWMSYQDIKRYLQTKRQSAETTDCVSVREPRPRAKKAESDNG